MVSLTNYALGQVAAGVVVRLRTVEGYPDISPAVRLPPPIDEKVFPLDWPSKLGRSRALRRFLRGEQSADIYHLHGAWLRTMYYGCLEAKRRSRPYLIQINGSYQPYDLRRKPWRKRIARVWFQDQMLQEATCLHVNSLREARQLRDLGFDRPTVIIPAGFDTVGAEALAAKTRDVQCWPDVPSGSFFLYLARIHPNKGIDLLLEAWRRLAGKYRDLKLLIVGTGEPRHVRWCEEMITRLGIADRVIWRGFVSEEEKAWCYIHSRFYCLPSHTENFGNTVQEALGYSTPVLTTTETPWENISEEHCGWIAECTSDGIAAQLDRALSRSNSELRKMGACGRALIEKDYSLNSVIQKQVKTYQWLMGGEAPQEILFKGSR